MSYVLVISRRRDFNDRRRYEADSAPKVRRHGVRKIGGFWLFGADFRDLGVFYLPARSTAQEMQYISFASGFMRRSTAKRMKLVQITLTQPDPRRRQNRE